MLKEKQCEDRCPYCGSEEIIWLSTCTESIYDYDEYRCDNCNKRFKEYYEVISKYICTEYEE